MSAMHEAAHVVIAHHLGIRSTAHIWRNQIENPECDKTWIGRAIFYSDTGKLSRIRRAMIGVAGAVAEMVCSDPEFDPSDDSPWWDDAAMSASDWQMTGCDPGEPDAQFMRAVARAHELLASPLRAELLATGRRLIDQARYVDSIDQKAAPPLDSRPAALRVLALEGEAC